MLILFGFDKSLFPNTYKAFVATPVYKDEIYSRWKENWNQGKSNLENLIHYASTTANNNWTGIVNGVVDLGFDVKEDLNATGFQVKVYDNRNQVVSTQTFNKSELESRNITDGIYYIMPLKTNWAGVSSNINYSVELSTLGTDNVEESAKTPISCPNKLVLNNPSWNFYDTYWQGYKTRSDYNSLFGLSG